MSQTPREVFKRAITFQNPDRIPRDLWTLGWATSRFPAETEELLRRFPPDLVSAPAPYRPSSCARGSIYDAGSAVDDWGCVFENLMPGVHGEVRNPIIKTLDDWKSVKPPYETLPEKNSSARDTVNRFCGNADKFVRQPTSPRPWERYQFLRSTVEAMMDVALMEPEFHSLLRTIHEFFLKEMEFWASTDVDALFFMDDWGSQEHLLIHPESWRKVFKPLYKDYCDIAHAAGKRIMMHSDGQILDIIPDLIEIGVDVLNSQLFCMDIEGLGRMARGKLAFWGEIDRQHILISPDPEVGRQAVRRVAKNLLTPAGGVIALLEFGVGANPKTVLAIYEEWEKVGKEVCKR